MKALCVLIPLFLTLGALTATAGPQVISVSPVAHSHSSDVMTSISITFDQAIDPVTINPSTVMISGRWSGIPAGSFSFEAGDTRMVFTPAEPFSTGEWVTVSLSKGVTDAGGDPIDFGYAWNFWIGSAPGTLDQTLMDVIEVREQGEGWIQTYGANAADLDNDGWTDLTLPNEISADVRVFMNDAAGGYDSFTIHPIPNGSIPSTNEAVDLDGDGDFDFVVGSGGNNQMCVFIGDGMGGFESATSYAAGQSVRGVATLDLDGDGDMDIVTANRVANNLSVFLNNGDGTMQPAISLDGHGVQETSLAAADANGDGILDLFVGALSSDEVILFLGDGNGGLVFSDEISVGGSPWMLAPGDMDGDGNVDVVAANSFENNAAIVFGDGQGGLSGVENYPVGSFALAIDVGDLDGDGDLEIVTSNYSSGDWSLYENLGAGVMGNLRTLAASTAGSCATLHDRDNDGDLDITGIDEIDDLIFVFENPGSGSVTCGEIDFFGAKCNALGAAQSIVKLFNSTEFAGEIVEFRLDDTIYPVELMTNGTHTIARLQVRPAGLGQHTITLVSPDGCYDPVVFNCQVDEDPVFDALWAEDDEIAEMTTAGESLPTETALLQNHPNPFNPMTTISYTLSVDSRVTLNIYDLLGREVVSLTDDFRNAGSHSVVWDGTDNHGRSVASGLYIYRLQARQTEPRASMVVETRTLMLVR